MHTHHTRAFRSKINARLALCQRIRMELRSSVMFQAGCCCSILLGNAGFSAISAFQPRAAPQGAALFWSAEAIAVSSAVILSRVDGEGSSRWHEGSFFAVYAAQDDTLRAGGRGSSVIRDPEGVLPRVPWRRCSSRRGSVLFSPSSPFRSSLTPRR